MPAHSPEPSALPFSAHAYRIVRRPPGKPNRVDIHASGAAPLRVGDHYTIGGEDGFCDVVVEEIVHGADGGWNAHCHVSRLPWL